jgi:hypothetical protein
MSAHLRHLYLGHLSRECNRAEIARKVMAQRLEKIGATHVRLEVTTQNMPSPTLELDVRDEPPLPVAREVPNPYRTSLEPSCFEQGVFREML